MSKVTRKQFLAAAGGGTVLLWLQSCGGGGDAGSGNGGLPPELSSCGSTIGGNHGHAMSVSVNDLSATAAKVYDIQGAADHTHFVTLSTADLATLKSGASVTVTSTSASSASTTAHTHSVTVACS